MTREKYISAKNLTIVLKILQGQSNIDEAMISKYTPEHTAKQMLESIKLAMRRDK